MFELYINTAITPVGATMSPVPIWETLDLFDNESVIIKDKLSDAQDIGKLFTTYSQQFKIPASPNNNRIMGGVFKDGRIDVSDQIQARITIDGTVYKDGIIANGESDMEYGKLVNYKINFSSSLSGIKDRLGDKVLSDLDVDNAYITGWTTGLVLQELITARVPLVSVNRRYNAYNSSQFGSSFDYPDNIRYIGDIPSATSASKRYIYKEELRPSVDMDAIFSRILYSLGYSMANSLVFGLRMMCTSDNYKTPRLIIDNYTVFPPVAYPFSGPMTTDWHISTTSPDIINLWTTNPGSTQSGGLSYNGIYRNAFLGMAEPKLLVDVFDVTGGTSSTNPNGILFSSKSVEATMVTPANASEERNPRWSFSVNLITVNNNIIPGTSAANPRKYKIFVRPNIYNNSSENITHNIQLTMGNGNLLDGYYQIAQSIKNMGVLYTIGLLPNMKQYDFLQSVLKLTNSIMYTRNNYQYNTSSNGLIPVYVGLIDREPDNFDYDNAPDFSEYLEFEKNTINVQNKYGIYSFSNTVGKDDRSIAWTETNVDNPNSKEYGQLLYNVDVNNSNKYDVKTLFVTPPQELIEGSLFANFSTQSEGKFVPNQPIIYQGSSVAGSGGRIPSSDAINTYLKFNLRDTGIHTTTSGYSLVEFASNVGVNEGSSSLPALVFKDEVNLTNMQPNSDNLYSRYYDYTVRKITQKGRYIFKFTGWLPSSVIATYNIYEPNGNLIRVQDRLYEILESDLDIVTGRIKLTCANYAPMV